MSTAIIRIIPKDETTIFPKSISDQVVDHLNSYIRADNISVTVHDAPVFVDCGGNLEEIICPACGEEIPFDWWGEAMDKASTTDFSDLAVELPCCGQQSSLNDLKYDFPCGFARWVLEISDPVDEISGEVLVEIEAIMGEELRMIEAHY